MEGCQTRGSRIHWLIAMRRIVHSGNTDSPFLANRCANCGHILRGKSRAFGMHEAAFFSMGFDISH